MKKLIVVIFLIIISIVGSSFYVYSDQDLFAKVVEFKIFVNNGEKLTENPLVLINDKTYIALSEISELLGVNVKWNAENKSILINNGFIINDEVDDTNMEILYPFEDNKLWGYKDKGGNVVVWPQYYEAEEFSNGLGLVRLSSGQDGNYGYIDNTGKIVIPCIYPYANSFSDGVALVNLSNCTDNDIWRYIDTHGNYLFSNTVDLPGDFHDGYAVALKEGYSFPVPSSIDVPKKWSYIDKSGYFVTDKTFEEASDFCNGYACVKNNGKWGIIDKNFDTVVSYVYDDIKYDENGEIIGLNGNNWEIVLLN